jgi:hypothetical protein
LSQDLKEQTDLAVEFFLDLGLFVGDFFDDCEDSLGDRDIRRCSVDSIMQTFAVSLLSRG